MFADVLWLRFGALWDDCVQLIIFYLGFWLYFDVVGLEFGWRSFTLGMLGLGLVGLLFWFVVRFVDW